jgi:hypothetical protein
VRAPNVQKEAQHHRRLDPTAVGLLGSLLITWMAIEQMARSHKGTQGRALSRVATGA